MSIRFHLSFKLIIVLMLFFATVNILDAQVEDFSLTAFSMGYSRPVSIVHAGGDDSRLFIIEQRGKIFICDSVGTKSATPFLDLSTKVSQTGNETGLLGLAFHPNYFVNGFFFVHYTNTSNGESTLARYSVSADPDIALDTSGMVFLTVSQPYTNHNGGDMHFGPDGYLYLSIGDGGDGGDPLNKAQDKTALLGKILRLDIDGETGYTIPSDNPFVNDLAYAPEIWALGLRNTWKFSFDRITGDKWIADVGQQLWEEVNFESHDEKGKNYGWRCYEGNATFNTSGCGPMGDYDFPVYVYASDGSTTGCSVTGGFRYRGAKYKNWWGSYFHTDYCSGKIWETQDSNSIWTTRVIADMNNFEFVSFGQDRYGELYVAKLNSGEILKLQDTTSTPKAYILESNTASYCGEKPVLHALKGEGFTYQWFYEGNLVAASTTDTLCPDQNGNYSLVVTAPGGARDTSSSTYLEICDFETCLEQSIIFTQWLINKGLYTDLNTQQNIIATGSIANLDSFRLNAGTYIRFGPNFDVELGGILEAQIEDCGALPRLERIKK